ncbi:MAG: O-antigen ligase family protein [Bacteroidota bacterium]
MPRIKLEHIPLYLLACFPLLGMKFTVWAIILFVLTALIRGHYSKGNKMEMVALALTSGLFLFIVARSLIPTSNPESLSYIEVSISLLVLPVAFHLQSKQLNQHVIENSWWIFIAATLICFAYGMAYSLYQVSQMVIASQGALSYHIRTLFENAVDYHPTHASIVLGIALLKLLDMIFNSEKPKWLLIAFFVIAIVIQALLASRTPIACTLVCLLSLTYLKTASFKKTVMLFAILAGGAIVSFLSIPSFSARFKEVSVENTKMPDKKSEDSFNLRTGIFKCGTGIVKDHWLWGVGPGHVKSELNKCYDSVAREVYRDKNFNTHNQFIDYWAGLGVLGPMMLIGLFVTGVLLLWQRGDWLGICVLILFLGAMQTENVLTRQNGIVTFCYFIGLHIFATRFIKPSKPEATASTTSN